MSRMKEKALHVGYIMDDATEEIYLQLPCDDPGSLGFVICDGDQTWKVPPFASWTALADDDSRISDMARDVLQAVLEEERWYQSQRAEEARRNG